LELCYSLRKILLIRFIFESLEKQFIADLTLNIKYVYSFILLNSTIIS
jgi:hypothetical protein